MPREGIMTTDDLLEARCLTDLRPYLWHAIIQDQRLEAMGLGQEWRRALRPWASPNLDFMALDMKVSLISDTGNRAYCATCWSDSCAQERIRPRAHK